VMSVDSDITVLDTFPVWVHTCSYCVDADSPTHSCRHSELCFGWLFNEDQCQSMSLLLFNYLIQKTISIQFISTTMSKSKAITISSGMGTKQGLPFMSGWTLLSEACVPFFIGSCGHSCNLERPSWSCSLGTPVLRVVSV